MKKINLRQVGNNVITILDGKKFSRSTTKEDRDILFKKIELFNKKNSDKLYNDIVKLLTPVKEQAKKVEETKQVAAKGKIKLVKKEQKKVKVATKDKTDIVKELTERMEKGTISDEEMGQLEILFAKNKRVTEEVKPVVSQSRRSGEY